MEKVGIITFCDNTNYGSFLQTYGLYKAIEQLGVNVELIDYRKDVPDYERITISGIKRILDKNGYEKGLRLIFNTYKMQKAFDLLIVKMMKKSAVYNRSTILKCHHKYNTYIVGSDLVWDVRYAGDYTYMLDFVDTNIRKISYAASYGYEEIPDEEKPLFKEYLSKFNDISVREMNAKDELSELLERNVYHVCDPTMLLSNDFWKGFITKQCFQYKYVVVYLPDPKLDILREAKRYARKHRLRVYFVDKANSDMCPKDPIAFLNLIYYAEKVFTASYHGVLFSVYFEKEFAFIKGKPSNRLDTVSSVLGLEEYNINSDSYNPEKSVNYREIKEKEEGFRKRSREILKDMVINEGR